MKIEIDMDITKKFSVRNWYANSPDFVMEALRSQLKAATAIWPELSNFGIEEYGKGRRA